MSVPPMLRRSFWYWDRRSEGDGLTEPSSSSSSSAREGVVVVLGWMLSRRRNLAPYTRLYKSKGWDCLVCHPHFLNLAFPSGATTLAVSVLEELAKELEKQACPVVFAVFSGGHKACLYKIIQILLGKCQESAIEERKLTEVRKSLSGLIFDSSPLDVVGHLGAKFVSHQVLTLKPGRPIGVVSWASCVVSKGIDVLFSRQLGQERINLWQALYSSVKIGPILFLCSKDDILAPLETIQMFASNLQRLGGHVDMVMWEESEHVGHFRRYPEKYSEKVTKLLREAVANYFERSRVTSGVEWKFEEKGIDIEASINPIFGSWTDLPESITTEIMRIARLPHVDVKKRLVSANGGAFHGVDFHTCAESWDRSNEGSRSGSKMGLRSRL